MHFLVCQIVHILCRYPLYGEQMTEEASALDVVASSKSIGSHVQVIGSRGPSAIIHVGRPDVEEPHRSMKRVLKLRQDNPEVRLFILVWTKEDEAAMKPYEDEKIKTLLWETDETLSNFLMDFLNEIVGAVVIGPKHYVCEDKHITESAYAGLLTECGTCKKPVQIVLQHPEKAQEFTKIFSNVISLANFDTRSGEYLVKATSPTANILRNMRYIDGCDHDKPPDVKGDADGKTMLV